jgi:phenylacetate-CoA ligase
MIRPGGPPWLWEWIDKYDDTFRRAGMSQKDRNAGILNEQEKFSPSQRKDYQEEFLRDLARHAYDSGTPFKESLDSIGAGPDEIRSLEDLSRIPVTKKTDLLNKQHENPPFGGFCTTPPSELVRIHQSPGPIYDPVGKSPDYWRFKTAIYSVGFRPGDIVVNTFAYHLTPAGHMFEEGVSELGCAVVPTGVGNTEAQVEIIKALGVTGYVGTPSFLMGIINKAESMGLNPAEDFKLEVGFLLAEMLPESLRLRFKDQYNILGRQAYGTADVGCVSYECPHINGMHVHYDVIVQICDPETGAPVPEGQPGEVVVTPNNRTYPLIRFGTGDLSSIVEDECPCGRTGPRLTRIMGRADQVTKVKGMFVHPSQVQKVIDAHPEIVRARLVVDRPGDVDIMTLEVELKEAAAEHLAAAVENTLKDMVKLKGKVTFVGPGTIKEEGNIIEDVRKWD